MTLPTDAQERKDTPVFSGVLRYFPRAIAYVALVSKAGNDQHHPGTPLHWDKSKSTDEGDALVRHQMEAGTVDTDGILHSGKVAWRGLAQLERELEAAELSGYVTYEGRPMTKGEAAKVPVPGVDKGWPDQLPRTISQKTLEDGYEELQRQKAEDDRGEDWTWLP